MEKEEIIIQQLKISSFYNEEIKDFLNETLILKESIRILLKSVKSYKTRTNNDFFLSDCRELRILFIFEISGYLFNMHKLTGQKKELISDLKYFTKSLDKKKIEIFHQYFSTNISFDSLLSQLDELPAKKSSLTETQESLQDRKRKALGPNLFHELANDEIVLTYGSNRFLYHVEGLRKVRTFISSVAFSRMHELIQLFPTYFDFQIQNRLKEIHTHCELYFIHSKTIPLEQVEIRKLSSKKNLKEKEKEKEKHLNEVIYESFLTNVSYSKKDGTFIPERDIDITRHITDEVNGFLRKETISPTVANRIKCNLIEQYTHFTIYFDILKCNSILLDLHNQQIIKDDHDSDYVIPKRITNEIININSDLTEKLHHAYNLKDLFTYHEDFSKSKLLFIQSFEFARYLSLKKEYIGNNKTKKNKK